MDIKINSNNLDYRHLMEQQRNNAKNIKSDNKANKKNHDYDLKIVSFMLGQQYYAIDIMAVKEIINASKFTRIPNALDFVMGVLNIRGEIITIINLCKMFHLTEREQEGEDRQIIVIKIDNLSIGLVVDKISQVLPLRKADIQPPSPLLGGINERYIDGVVEVNNRLYVILDIEYIFSDKEKAKPSALSTGNNFNEEVFAFFCNQIESLAGVHITNYNRDGFAAVFTEYAQTLPGTDMPKLDASTANALTGGVKSNFTESMWDEPYIQHFAETVGKSLAKICKSQIRVLDLGCGMGHEAYSLYFLLDNQFSEKTIEIVAADVNLNAVSDALDFALDGKSVPNWISKDKYLVKLGENTYKVKRDVQDQITFEFHNAVNVSTYEKDFDLVVARDLSLYTSNDEYKTFIEGIKTKIVSGGVLLVGDNENIGEVKDFEKLENPNLHVFIKK